MGRPESPVDLTVPARGELAEALRALRAGAGLTYAELAANTCLSAATLKRAASGRTVPSWETAKVFASACGSLPAGLHRAWLKARIAERGRLKQLRRPRSPELATTLGDLGEAMEYSYESAGAPSLRQLQERAGGSHLLPVSSAARIVNREALPASRQQCFAFLIACGLPDRAAERWAQAFDRITSHRDLDPELLSDLEAALTITMNAALHKQIDRRFEPHLQLSKTIRRRPETLLGAAWTRKHFATQTRDTRAA
ncbi:helix-turn-helix domain-containing protein [Streptomyces sp. NPDC056400]|uniref:helix-turn-helix domain-containing protein n=1 Tax=Streptomyces sp. NPDC056400 TaxID=3345808 RepID=UPI0035D6AE42